jgi:hypothetical protein
MVALQPQNEFRFVPHFMRYAHKRASGRFMVALKPQNVTA